MASFIFNSFIDDLARGNIDADTDTFYALLTTATYAEDKDAHTKRSNVTNEIAAGGGYVAGGFPVTVTVTKDNANDRVDIALGGFAIPAATISARKAVYYKRRGGAASADELVAVVDFGTDVTSTNAAWTLSPSTIRFANP